MASISAKAARGHHTFTLTVTQTSQSNTANTSTLSYALSITPTHSSFQWNGEGTSISYSVVINGSTVASGYIPDYDGATKNIASGTTTVTHNAGGAKSISYSFSVADKDEESYTCGDASASGTMTLTTISIASYTLSISQGTGSTITVNRTSSPKKGAATGNLSNGAAVYYGDVLKITFGAGANYNLGTHTVNGSSFTSGGSHTVTKAVSVVSTATGKTYTITYNANGGSGTMAATTYTYATSGTVNLRTNTFTRTGYTFLGWSQSSTATSASYTDGHAWGKNNGSNYTLYAVWSIKKHYLDLNGICDEVPVDIAGFGTADIYINGSLVADDVGDYWKQHNYGTTYEIKDIKAVEGKSYDGVSSGSLSGTITGETNVVLKFSTKTYTLSISAEEGCNVIVKKGDTVLTDGATVKHGDSLTITFEAESGREIGTHTVNGNPFTSGDTLTVTSAISIVVTAKMLGAVYIDTGTSIEKFLIYIDIGTELVQLVPYTEDGTDWDMCS